ncbi:MAG: glycosyltransferase [Gammaproteobacteria bacterium]|nr:glycosyltransferase [Gammaproteobacteria bacterium]
MRAVIIGKQWPEPTATAAGSRTLQLIQLLQQEGWEIHFGSAAEEGEQTLNLRQLEIHCHPIRLNHHSFDHWLKALNPELVIFDRFMTEEQFSWRVQRHCPDAIRLLDTQDFHALRQGRGRALQLGEPFVPQHHMAGETLLRELASLYRCDLSLLISPFEMELLQQQWRLPEQLIHYTPFLAPKQRESTPPFQQRQHCLFIGGFRHPPNVDAVRWLYAKIWPRVRQHHPQLECHIYGPYPPAAIRQLHQPAVGFLLKGRAEAVGATMEQYRLNLAPLRFGAGQKGKIIDGWVYQTPTITTPIGAEGMGCPPYRALEIAEDEASFAAAIHHLYSHQKPWDQLNQEAKDTLNHCFNPADHGQRLLQKIAQLREDLHHHRQSNIVGQILWREQFRATEFMGRWIELKEGAKEGCVDAPERERASDHNLPPSA